MFRRIFSTDIISKALEDIRESYKNDEMTFSEHGLASDILYSVSRYIQFRKISAHFEIAIREQTVRRFWEG